MSDEAIVRYKYDRLGRVLNEGFGESAGNVRWGVDSKYDRRGARESLTYPTAAGWQRSRRRMARSGGVWTGTRPVDERAGR